MYIVNVLNIFIIIKLLSKEKLIKFIKKYINTNNQIIRIIEGH
jgi:hypothetical protein